MTEPKRGGVAPHLPVGFLEDASAMGLDIESEVKRAEVLRRLAARVTALSSLARVWLEERAGTSLLHTLARCLRQHLFWDPDGLAPVLPGFGDPRAVMTVFRPIGDVGRWWL